MRKKLLIICLLLFCSGCTAEYQLEIKDDSFSTKIIVESVGADYESIDPSEFDREYFAYDKNQFNKVVENIPGGKRATLDYNFTFEEYKKSSPFNQCFLNNSIILGDEITYIVHSKYISNCGFATMLGYTNVTKLNISIKTDKEVNNHNADEVKDNVYLWHLKDDLTFPDIEFSYYNKVGTSRQEETEKQIKSTTYVLGGIIIVGVGILAILNYIEGQKKKTKKN